MFPIQYVACAATLGLLVQIRRITHGGQPRANTSVRFKMAPGRFEGVIERARSQLSPLGGEQTLEPSASCQLTRVKDEVLHRQ